MQPTHDQGHLVSSYHHTSYGRKLWLTLLHTTSPPPPVKALHSPEVVLTPLGQRRLATAPVKPVNVPDSGCRQLHSEVGGTAGLLAPLETGPVVGTLGLRTGQLSVPVSSQTLTCTQHATHAAIVWVTYSMVC